MSTASGDEALLLVRQGWSHLKARRPLAAWACWQQALRLRPGDGAAAEALDRLARAAPLPLLARVAHRLRSPGDEVRRIRWDAALRGRDLAALDAAAGAFAGLRDDDPLDPDAAFNLGLVRAWEGDNGAAIEQLHDFVRLTAHSRPEDAANAWGLAEILRHGGGLEERADDRDYAGSLPWLDSWDEPIEMMPGDRVHRVALAVDPSVAPGAAARPFEWLDRPMPEATPELTADDLPRVLVSLVYLDGRLCFSSPDPDDLDRFLDELDDFLLADAPGPDLWEHWQTVLPLGLLDAAAFRVRIPREVGDEERVRLSFAALAHAYEDRWIHRPRFGLSATVDGPPRTPLEAAAGGPVDQALVEGVIRLREQLARREGYQGLYVGYSFDRLRRRLGLPMIDANVVAEQDLSCMSRDELAALDLVTLDPDERDAARRSAIGLNDAKLIERFS